MKRLTYILACVLLAGAASATTYTWTNSSVGYWTNQLNWTANGNPGAASGDTATITPSITAGTNILDTTPANSLARINLWDLSGIMTLDVTNCSLTTAGISMEYKGVLQIDNGATVTDTSKLTFGQIAGYSYNTVLVNPGGTLSINGLNIEMGQSASTGNTFIVNGGTCTNFGSLQAGVNVGSYSNSTSIINGTFGQPAGYIYDCGQYSSFYASNSFLAGTLFVGYIGAYTFNSATLIGCTYNVGSSSSIVCGDGGGSANNSINISACTITNMYRLVCANNSSPNTFNSIIVSNGSYLSIVNQCGMGINCAGTSNTMQFGGNGVVSIVTNAGAFSMGAAGSSYNTFILTNCQFYCVGGFQASPAPETGLVCYVENGGYLWVPSSKSIYEGTAATAVSNVLYVLPGGVIECSTLSVTTGGGGNMIVNNGGTYQFYSASPTITPGTFGNITCNGGTISFHNCGSADVRCNYATAGKPLRSDTLMLFAGTNGFYLNAATNLASGQAYTFAPGTATNWASLTLTNGAVWQGGDVTIGSGGMLSGAGTIANNLILQSGATLYGTADSSYITVSSNVTLNGTLSIPPGFVPSVLGTPVLASRGTISGAFSSLPTNTYVTITGGTVLLYPWHNFQFTAARTPSTNVITFYGTQINSNTFSLYTTP